MTLFNLKNFKMAPPTINFFTNGVEVGSDNHLLCTKLKNWRVIPGHPLALMCRTQGLAITVRIDRDYIPSDVALYDDVSAKEEFEEWFLSGDAIFKVLPRTETHPPLQVCGLGHFLIETLKEFGLWDKYIKVDPTV